ncbi:hypothetical protein MPSEU_000212400 [Mayamaea pseudoterrestris]|nr:hypothetical protein MPSEU_000212400 [Mayamaea pseudoterrestris]
MRDLSRKLCLCILLASLENSSGFLKVFPPVPHNQNSFVTTCTVLRESIASASERAGKDSNVNDKTLSRPQRKALERQRKAKRIHTTTISEQKQSKKRSAQSNYDGQSYSLHSNAVSQLDINSTAENVVRAIKRAQNLHDSHDMAQIARFLLEQTDATFFYGFRGSLLARLAVAALHLNQTRVATAAMQERSQAHADTIAPFESAALVRGLLRVHNVTEAWDIVNAELAVPDIASSELLSDAWTVKDSDVLKHRALSLASIASRHFFEGEPCRAVAACQHLAQLGPLTRNAGMLKNSSEIPWARLIRGAAMCETGRRNGTVVPCDYENGLTPTVPALSLPCNLVHAVLDAMSTFPSENDDRVYEQLSNALVRRVLFVTGAIDMRGCPDADRGEAAFIGRSNVGKSSLVNMVTNRKSLAYTSKRPGKTQQFNFFAVNDKPGLEKEVRYGDQVEGEKDPDSFYIVDLPGFGYARVPEKQRQAWIAFMNEYLSERRTLRVVFHLIDGRIGPTDDDTETMARVGAALKKSSAQYVVVLTKADKNVKNVSKKNSGKVSREVMQKVRDAMNENGIGKAPIIVTSAETKLGRDDIWRYLRQAAEA